jgi:DNA invertase Pin-like site-specific DNA recombinase
MKAIIYARESSDDTNKAPPIEEQIKRGKQYIEEQGFELIQTFEDNGFSGGNWNRPAFNQLIRLARGHRFNIVIVWNSDRIARDTEQFLFFNRNMKESHVKVFSLTEGEINLDTVGDTAKNISIAMANEIFRKVTSEKVKRAYEMKKRKAKDQPINWGRPKQEYDLNKILTLREQGKGYRLIAKELNCSYQTIRRILLQNTPQENKQDLEENHQLNKEVTE